MSDSILVTPIAGNPPAAAAPVAVEAHQGMPLHTKDDVSRYFAQAKAIVEMAFLAFEGAPEERPQSIFVLNTLQHALALVYEARNEVDDEWNAQGKPASFGRLHGSLVSTVALLEVLDTTTWLNGGDFPLNDEVTSNYLWAIRDVIYDCIDALKSIPVAKDQQVAAAPQEVQS